MTDAAETGREAKWRRRRRRGGSLVAAGEARRRRQRREEWDLRNEMTRGNARIAMAAGVLMEWTGGASQLVLLGIPEFGDKIGFNRL